MKFICMCEAKMKIAALLLAAVTLSTPLQSLADDGPRFVGTKTCAQCHEAQYGNFTKYSKKAHAWNSIAVMKPKLKDVELKQCYECHTTGYGKPGGFVSKQDTPDLADVGCETCHGPGSLHAESGDPTLVTRTPTIELCQKCHNSQRVADFKFKPLVSSGAH
jgi:mono/diheme cytochrome c family protein